MLTFDHLAVSARSLDEGAAAVEAALGVPLQAGGRHPHMATHNRLLGLGDIYLEVIAADPAQPGPIWPRWFDLDRFDGPPRVTNWIARCADLDAELAASPPGTGKPVALSRGAYAWQMAVPADGVLPFDGAFPALMRWEGSAHPARAMEDRGIRLTRLEIGHPEAGALRTLLAGRITDARVAFVPAAVKSMQATFSTPQGLRKF
jgi:hypothetical protein